MQQLIPVSHEKIVFGSEISVAIGLQSEPDWDDAGDVFEHWLISQGFKILHGDFGADRYTWQLDLAGLPCFFHAELLTSSYWFECDGEVCADAILLGL